MKHFQKIKKSPVVFVAGAMLVASSAFADGFRNPPPSVSALGHSGGNLTFTDDASSLAINPANMVAAESYEFQFGGVTSIVGAEFSSASGASKEQTNRPVAQLPNVFAVAPFDVAGTKVVAGLGLTVPYGRSSDWDSSVAFASSTAYTARLRTFDIKPTIAAKICDNISVGAGLDIYYSDLTSEQLVPWSAFTGMPSIPGVSTSDGDGWGVGANAGATWEVVDGHRLSFVYRSAFDIDYSGDFQVTNIPTDGSLPLPPGAISPNSSFDSTIKYPHVFGLGYGVELSETVKVGVDFEYITHSRFESMPLDLGVNNILLPSREIEKDWKDNWTLGAAADWNFADDWNAFLGYVYIESPIPDRTFSPLEADADEHLVSVGVSHTFGEEKKDHLHAMFAYGFMEERNISDNINPAINGEYDFSVQFVGLSYQRDL